MTLSQLAALAHVSTSTVSKAFSMSAEVNEGTREMIFEVAKKHGCFKQFYRSEYTGLVFALICPEFDSSYYATLISEMQKCLVSRNSELCVASTDFSAETEKKLIEYYERYHTVDGIILINGHSDYVYKNDVPIALVNCFTENRGTVNVTKDESAPLMRAIEYWVNSGSSEIGFIGDTYTVTRRRMLEHALTEYIGSYDKELFKTATERYERGGYEVMCELIASGKIPRCIVCAYDRLAFGAMRALHEHNIKIPDEVALIGFDDAPQSAYQSPSLTSINHEVKKTCETIVEELFKRINGEKYSEDITITCTLVERESSVMK